MTYHTGETCPESGVYRLVNCDKWGCSKAQREIPLSKGERFPPCRNCGTGRAEWKLVRKA